MSNPRSYCSQRSLSRVQSHSHSPIAYPHPTHTQPTIHPCHFTPTQSPHFTQPTLHTQTCPHSTHTVPTPQSTLRRIHPQPTHLPAPQEHVHNDPTSPPAPPPATRPSAPQKCPPGCLVVALESLLPLLQATKQK
nr:extensin-like [Penaeus vannamei]